MREWTEKHIIELIKRYGGGDTPTPTPDLVILNSGGERGFLVNSEDKWGIPMLSRDGELSTWYPSRITFASHSIVAKKGGTTYRTGVCLLPFTMELRKQGTQISNGRYGGYVQVVMSLIKDTDGKWIATRTPYYVYGVYLGGVMYVSDTEYYYVPNRSNVTPWLTDFANFGLYYEEV